MKKGICICVIILAFVLSVSALAVEPRSNSLALSFNGTTAVCGLDVSGISPSSKVNATIMLYEGSTCVETWYASSSGPLSFSETHEDCVSGTTYKLMVSVLIDGKVASISPKTATCP